MSRRRAAWRANARNQYAVYRRMCDECGVPSVPGWTRHLAELREARVPAENRELWRNTRSPYKRFWLERFPLAELVAMGSDL